MELIKCKECGNQVSNTAKYCPQCGAKVVTASGCGTIIGLVILGLFVLALVGNCLGGDNQSSRSNSSSSAVQNAGSATLSDVAQAESFLKSLPAACSASHAYTSDDGTVNIRTICNGSGESMDGLISIKNGVVTKIR